MWEWLLSPSDASRVHDVSFAVAWHGRSMTLAWGILAPLAVLVARFFKVLPGQDWPNNLDNKVWWRGHWIGHSAVLCLTIGALALVWPLNVADITLHRVLGYAVLMGLLGQVALGIFRGSKGGPSVTALDMVLRGDHYDMTRRRLAFEMLHKTMGYGVLLLAVATILVGLWDANGPPWMWLVLIVWWSALVCAFYLLQRRGMAVDTYQAIWGHDISHPGNQRPSPKWGMRRRDDLQGGGNVRRN